MKIVVPLSYLGSTIQPSHYAPPKVKIYHYIYYGSFQPRSIYVVLSKFTKEELDLIDNLMFNIDEGNLGIVKGIINSKKKWKKII